MLNSPRLALLPATALLLLMPWAAEAQADPTFLPNGDLSLGLYGQTAHQTITSPYSDCSMIISAQSTDAKIADISPKGPVISNTPVQFAITAGTTRGGSATIIYLISSDPQGCVKGYQYNFKVTLKDIAKPTIKPNGVTPLYSTRPAIQSRNWFSVYGSDLVTGDDQTWKGDFATSLGGTSLTVNNKPAAIWFAGFGQINAQAPDDTATGTVPVVVTTPNGTATTTVTLASASPAFSLLGDGTHIAGIIYTPDGTGSQGGGTYDFLGPTSLGKGFRPAKKTETVSLYGVAFGDTNPIVPAGPYTCPTAGCAQLVNPPTFSVGSVPVNLTFAGLVGPGLYQFNFQIPASLSTGDQTLVVNANGLLAQPFVSIPVQ